MSSPKTTEDTSLRPVVKMLMRARSPQLELAGELGVAFLNTAGARPENRQLGVSSYADFVTWSQQIGTVSAAEAERRRRRAAERPAEAETAFALVDEARTAFAHSFLAAQRQEPAAETHLDAFNQALAKSSLEHRLVTAERGAVLVWVGDPDALDSLLAPILSSVHELIAAARGQPHVRQCAAPGCRLFFVDRTTGGRRKWCAMETCGHRVKNQRHYRRVVKAEREHRRKNALRKPRQRS